MPKNRQQYSSKTKKKILPEIADISFDNLLIICYNSATFKEKSIFWRKIDLYV